MESQRRSHTLAVLLIAGAIVLSFLFTIQTLYVPWGKRIDFNDSAIYQYIGFLITKGKIPYVDAFDHKGIYFYFINALGYLINPKCGMWPILWAAMLVVLLVTYLSAKKFLNTLHSAIIAIVVGAGIANCFWDGNTPDFFAMLLCLCATMVLLQFFQRNTLRRIELIFIGGAASIAFWMKPNMVASVLLMCACIIVSLLLRKDFLLTGKCFVFFGIGFVIASLPGLLWLNAHGAISSMIEDYFLFNVRYSSFYAGEESMLFAFGFFVKNPAVYATMGCLIYVLLSLLQKKESVNTGNNGMLLCGSVSFCGSLFLITITGNVYEQYATMLFPSIVLILIGTIRRIVDKGSNRRLFLLYIPLGITCIVLCFTAFHEFQYCRFFWREIPQENEELSYIMDNTVPGETIAVVSPYYTGLYIASGREAASKNAYVQLQHFVGVEDAQEYETAFWKEYANELTEKEPKLILLDRDYEHIDLVADIMKQCLQNYTDVGTSYHFEIYTKKNGKDSPPAFESKYSTERGIGLSIPEDAIEAYRRGEMSEEDIQSMVDEQFDELFGLDNDVS